MIDGAPVVQAVVMADHVYQDRDTGKYVVAGTFHQLRASAFPCELTTPIHAFCVLTSVAAPIAVSMQLVSPDGNVVMSSSALTVTCLDPQQMIEFAFPVPSLQLPVPGWYRLVLLIDDTPRGSARLEVQQTGG
jgi:hypothetical protein